MVIAMQHPVTCRPLLTSVTAIMSLRQFPNPVKVSGHYMYHQVSYPEIRCFAHILYLCVWFGCENKQQALPIQHQLTGFYS